MSEASGGDPPISNQLANLVPTFDPSKDDMNIYQQKVELVLAAWPKTKITELTTRLILNCTGTAFQKLQLHQSELLAENDPKSVQLLIKLLGGQWGRISLEKQYQEAETALFGTTQRADESNDSYLARADVQWMKLLAQKLKIEDLQAYVVLRGSQLSPEDKKKVILESDTSLEGKLTISRVNEAVRLLGASFFQDMTGGKRTNRTKVYEGNALLTEPTDGDGPEEAFNIGHDDNEEEFIDNLAQDGDEDATLVADFELAASETLQDDPSLAEAFNAYQDARRRLSEKFRNRGFWPTSKGSYNSGKGKGGKFNKGKGGKGAFDNRPRRSLQDRILNSNCRICGRKGHWRAECPYKGTSQGSTTGSTPSSAMPTTTVITENAGDHVDVLPMEFMNLPEHRPIDEDTACSSKQPDASEVDVFHVMGQYKPVHEGIHGESLVSGAYIVGIGHDRLRARLTRNEPPPLQPDPSRKSESARDRLKQQVSARHARKFRPELCQSPAKHVPAFKIGHEDPPESLLSNRAQEESQICFATYGSMGVLDLGASKTVIGSEHVAEMLESLSPQVRRHVTRCECPITFRFGNQGTLQSKHAIIVPIGPLLLKIAVVPGGTPFLLSNSLMRALSAQINCQTKTLHSPMLQSPIKLTLTAKGLFLINLNELAVHAMQGIPAGETSSPTETFVSEVAEQKVSAVQHKNMIAKNQMQSLEGHAGRCQLKVDQQSGEGNPRSQNMCTPPPPSRSCEPSHVSNIPKDPQNAKSTTVTTSSVTVPADRSTAVLPNSDPIPSVSADPSEHVAATASSGHADEGVCSDPRPGPPDQRTAIPRSHRLWEQTQGQDIPGSVDRGPGMGHVYGDPIPRKHETQPQEVPQVHRPAAHGTRETPNAHTRDEEVSAGRVDSHAQECRKTKGQDLIGLQHPGPSRLSSYCGFRGKMAQWRDVRVAASDYDLRPGAPREHPGDAGAHGEHGASSESRHPVHRGEEPAEQHRAVSALLDNSAESCTAMHADRRTLNALIIQITKEFEEQLKSTKPMGNRWIAGEIFCSSQSPSVSVLGIRKVTYPQKKEGVSCFA